MSHHGLPCWYELTAADPAKAQAFYTGLLGWTWADSGMPGMTYLLAATPKGQVAGMMKAEHGQPLGWTCYVAVDHCDQTVAKAEALGARVIVPPADIPGTGRFALLIDPQGAGFGILQPLPGGAGGAFDQAALGHGNWHDLESPDPAAALAFYAAIFGWQESRAVPMGPNFTYHVIKCGELDIGGIYREGTTAAWKPYFGCASARSAVAAIPGLGGTVLHGPAQVPGGAFTVDARDAEGSRVALVGPA